MNAPTAPKRRWFRWSLRTLFVVVAVVGVALWWHGQWLKQRDAFLAIRSSEAEQNRVKDLIDGGSVHLLGIPTPVSWSSKVHVALLWAMHGPTRKEVTVVVDGGGTVQDSAREARLAQELFPEATINIAISR